MALKAWFWLMAETHRSRANSVRNRSSFCSLESPSGIRELRACIAGARRHRLIRWRWPCAAGEPPPAVVELPAGYSFAVDVNRPDWTRTVQPPARMVGFFLFNQRTPVVCCAAVRFIMSSLRTGGRSGSGVVINEPVTGLPETVLQSLAFAGLLFYWVHHADTKWLNWLLHIAFAIVISLSMLGLLARGQ
jgi:hypothetical protein